MFIAMLFSIEKWIYNNITYAFDSIKVLKEENLAVCSIIDEPWGHYIKQNQPVGKLPHVFTYISYLR
jgi:hypothetical protein